MVSLTFYKVAPFKEVKKTMVPFKRLPKVLLSKTPMTFFAHHQQLQNI